MCFYFHAVSCFKKELYFCQPDNTFTEHFLSLGIHCEEGTVVTEQIWSPSPRNYGLAEKTDAK